MGGAASVDLPPSVRDGEPEKCLPARYNVGTSTRAIHLPVVPGMAMPCFPRKTIFFAQQHKSADPPFYVSVHTTSKHRVRSGIEFKFHADVVTGMALLTSTTLDAGTPVSLLGPVATDLSAVAADAITSSEEFLITASRDGHLRVFDVGSQVAVICAAVGAPITGLAAWPPPELLGIRQDLGVECAGRTTVILSIVNDLVAYSIEYTVGRISMRPLAVNLGDARLPFSHATVDSPTSVARSHPGGPVSVLFAVTSGVCLCHMTARAVDFQYFLEVDECKNGLCGVSFLSVDNDTRFVVAGYDRVRLFDAISRAPLWVALGHHSLLTAVSCSMDGRRVVSGDWDGELRVWDASNGELLAVVTGAHRSAVKGARFLADDTFLLSWAAGEQAFVRSVPPFDARHALPYSVRPAVMPVELLVAVVSPFMAPSDLKSVAF